MSMIQRVWVLVGRSSVASWGMARNRMVSIMNSNMAGRTSTTRPAHCRGPARRPSSRSADDMRMFLRWVLIRCADGANVRKAVAVAESVNSPVRAGAGQAGRSARTSRMSSAREVTAVFWKTLRRW